MSRRRHRPMLNYIDGPLAGGCISASVVPSASDRFEGRRLAPDQKTVERYEYERLPDLKARFVRALEPEPFVYIRPGAPW
jgi:hypothetical protein